VLLLNPRTAPAADAQGHPLLEVFLVFTEQVGREPPDDLCQLLHDRVREIERIVDPPAVLLCPPIRGTLKERR